MCGISGMFGSPEPSIVKSMTRLQHHRGPDGKGIWNDEHISLDTLDLRSSIWKGVHNQSIQIMAAFLLSMVKSTIIKN
jgi:asparagine synthetase B (glutamine-hydrolysing)